MQAIYWTAESLALIEYFLSIVASQVSNSMFYVLGYKNIFKSTS